MNGRLITLVTTFTVAACGGAVTPPAQAPVACGTPSARYDRTEGNPSASRDAAKTNRQHFVPRQLARGSSESEQRITANIRKLIMRNDTLSYISKNVSVLTAGNKVTLRGPVKRSVERTTIELLARQTDGVSEVDNQIEVKDQTQRK